MKEPLADSDSLFKFIKSFVIHLTAKRVLERYAFKTRHESVTITLFTADRSSLRIPAGSWPTMENIIRASFTSHSSSTTNAAKAIEMLVNIIRNLNPPSKSSKKSRDLLTNFRRIYDGHGIMLRAGMHCETLLATLKKYREDLFKNGSGDAELKVACEVLLLFTYLPALSHHLS
jgi:hypothetical protein